MKNLLLVTMTVLFFTACRNDKATSEQPQQQQQTETISEQGVENQVIEPETTEPITYVFKPKTGSWGNLVEFDKLH
jgi:PBP1b-binding outer membrane lipoprotein LpoB